MTETATDTAERCQAVDLLTGTRCPDPADVYGVSIRPPRGSSLPPRLANLCSPHAVVPDLYWTEGTR